MNILCDRLANAYTQKGFALLPVAIALVVIGSVALLINYQSANSVNRIAGDAEIKRAEYAAHAGLQHALWRAQNDSCTGDFTIPTTTIGADTYNVSTTGGGTNTAYTLSVDQDAWIRSDNPSQNNGSAPDLHTRFESGNIEQPLVRFDLSPLPTNAQIQSAVLKFYIENTKEHPEGSITLHNITADWTEDSVNWDSFNGSYDSAPIGVITAQDASGVWVHVNLTAQVQAWINGQPNYGILLNSVAEGVHAEYVSSEGNLTERPSIEVVVGTGAASPLNIVATGTVDTGLSRTLKRPAARAYQPSNIFTIRPDPTEGEDAEIWDQAPDNNYGNADETWVSSAATDTTRSLLRFNLNSIPAGAKILAATLSLQRESGSGSNEPVTAHRITNPWSEDSVTWNRRQTGINWDSSGADFDSTVIATTPVGPNNQRYEWDLTSLVQSWVDGSHPNYGVILIAGIPGLVGHRFYTSDEAQLDRRPDLIVTYACECNRACLAPKGNGRIVMIGDWGGPLPNPHDLEKEAIIESWGYEIDQADDDFIWLINFNNYDLVYVSETVRASDVFGQLNWRSIGIVIEEGGLYFDMGFADTDVGAVGNSLDIVDNSHYITTVFPAGALPIYNADMEFVHASGSMASGMQTLGTVLGAESLMTLEAGATTLNGAAPGRRVALPLGRFTDTNFNWDYLNNHGRLLVQRSIAWGMGADNPPPVYTLLMVVVDPDNLTAQEAAKKSLIESWGFGVTLIDESDSQSNFDTAVAASDVVFITEDVLSGNVGTKLVNAPIGVVTEEANLSDEFGFSAGIGWDAGTELGIDDNTHYITEPFAVGTVTILSTSESLAYLTPAIAPDAESLGRIVSGLSLTALDIGASIVGGGTSLGRRVFLPWGGNDMDVNHLSADGLTIFRRALEWGAGAGPTANTIILTTESSATLGGLDFTDKDLAEYNSFADSASLFFDGNALGLANDIDAVHVLANGNIVMSAINSVTLGGVTAENEDLIEYDPVNDTATLFFDGSALMSSGSTDISAVYVLPDSNLLLTNEYAVTLGGLSFDNNDIISYNPTNDTASIVLDGDAVGLSAWINAVHVLENGNIVLSIDGNGSLGGLNFEEGDLVEYDLANDVATLYFDHNLFSGNENIRAAFITGNSGSVGSTLPIAHWKLDETSGLTAVDSVGGHDGTLVSSQTWTTGAIDGGLEFNGIDDAIVVPNEDTLSLTEAMTFSAWIFSNNFGESGPYDLVVSKGSVATTYAYYFGTLYDEIIFGFSADGSYREFVTLDFNLATGTWHHIAATFDNASNTVKLYHNGVEVFSTTTTYEPSATTHNLYLGSSEDGADWDGVLDDIRIYDYALDGTDIAELAAQGGGGGGGGDPQYIETNELWYPSSSDSWETVDLTSYGVPPNAVVEIAVMNNTGNAENWAGVRAVGSSLERRLRLHEAEGGGNDVVVMHAQADAGSQIQTYADRTNGIVFILLGYWTGASYVERFDAFGINEDGSWRARDLSTFGVGADQVVEIAISNTSASAERLVGVREVGSSQQRRIVLHEAEAGGVDVATMFVNTNASSVIEVYAQDNEQIDFHLLGYWSVPPGTYTELGSLHSSPTVANTWHQTDPSLWGVPANSVMQFLVSNEVSNSEIELGIRSVGSSQNRVLEFQEAESGGADTASMHVNIDSNTLFEIYSEAGTTDRYFYPLGWWTLD